MGLKDVTTRPTAKRGRPPHEDRSRVTAERGSMEGLCTPPFVLCSIAAIDVLHVRLLHCPSRPFCSIVGAALEIGYLSDFCGTHTEDFHTLLAPALLGMK